MTPSDQVKLLGGTIEQQKQLYGELLNRINSETEPLQDYEVIFLEALRKIFTAEMSAVTHGAGGVQ